MREGNIVDTWTQWDSMLARPHFVAISPYDPDKHVWIVDDFRHAIFKFTNDGKQLVQTIGTYNEHGADASHFFRPTFIAWLPDGSFFVADGYENTRVVKFDASGKYLAAWGEKGTPPNDARPGFMNNVHGIAVDPATRRVFVNDRGNHRVQVFDENGKFLDQWRFGEPPSDIHLLLITRGWPPLGRRSRHEQDPEVRPRRPFPLLMGHVGRLPGRFLGRARDERRFGGQFLRRGSRQRACPKIRAARGCRSRAARRRPVA